MASDVMELRPYTRRPLPTLREIVAVVFRQRRVVLGTFVGVMVLVLLSGFWALKYEAHMKFLVLRQRTDAVVTASANAPAQDSGAITEEDLNSEVELIRSDDLLRKVVLSTNLQNRSFLNFRHFDNETAIASAVRRLEKDLDVEPIRKTNVIEVKYRADNSQLAVTVLNAVAKAYLEKHREVHRPTGEFTFFDQQTDRLKRGLEQSQSQLAEFTQKNGVVDAQVQKDLILQRLADFNATAHQAQASAIETAQRIRALQAQLSTTQPRLITEIRSGENPQLMQQLKSTLLNLELKQTELLSKYDPSYPLVQEGEKQIADTKASIEAEEIAPPKEQTTDQDPTYMLLRSDLAKAQADLSGFEARAKATSIVADQYRVEARKLQEMGLTQDDLKRTQKTEEENYLLYQRKREEARIGDALDQRGILNVAIAEQPLAPALPVRSPAKTGSFAVLLGLFLSVGTGFIADFADPSFRTPDEVVGYLEMPVLAALPRNTTE
jgi:succinoglycan biosynthesis transport protein ExoP